MISAFHPQDPDAWAELHFAGAPLGDVRRTERVQTIASAMAQNPGQSIPQLFDERYAVKAAYTFFDRQEATPERLQSRHRELVHERLSEEPGTYLLLEDGSEISFCGLNKPIEGLGFIGNAKEGLQGFLLHSVLAVRWVGDDERQSEEEKRPPVEVVGLASQSYRVRRHEPRGRGSETSAARKRRARESEDWLTSGAALGPAPRNGPSAAVRWVRVADRGADIYEFLKGCKDSGHGFVVRAAQDRGILDPHTGEPKGRLFSAVRRAPSLGEFTLELRGRNGRAARTAQLRVSALEEVVLVAPQRPGHARGKLPPVRCTAVRVWEEQEQAPVGAQQQPLEWILLTDREAGASFGAAHEVARWYSTRWLVEEFHKALKSGLGAEKLQLEQAGRLFAAIALMSVVAVRLVELRERVRLIPEAPADRSGLGALELEVLGKYTEKPIRTVREVGLALGRMGGHMGRKGDGMPGWITLWRGMSKLQALVEGVRLAQQMGSFG